MLKFEYEQPLLISGVYITEEMLMHLNYIQTGCLRLNIEYRRHNNQGVIDFSKDLSHIINYLIDNMIEAETEEKSKVIDLIERAHMLRSSFEDLKLPAELLSKEKS